MSIKPFSIEPLITLQVIDEDAWGKATVATTVYYKQEFIDIRKKYGVIGDFTHILEMEIGANKHSLVFLEYIQKRNLDDAHEFFRLATIYEYILRYQKENIEPVFKEQGMNVVLYLKPNYSRLSDKHKEYLEENISDVSGLFDYNQVLKIFHAYLINHLILLNNDMEKYIIEKYKLNYFNWRMSRDRIERENIDKIEKLDILEQYPIIVEQQIDLIESILLDYFPQTSQFSQTVKNAILVKMASDVIRKNNLKSIVENEKRRLPYHFL